jgi:hypothetical protein
MAHGPSLNWLDEPFLDLLVRVGDGGDAIAINDEVLVPAEPPTKGPHVHGTTPGKLHQGAIEIRVDWKVGAERDNLSGGLGVVDAADVRTCRRDKRRVPLPPRVFVAGPLNR